MHICHGNNDLVLHPGILSRYYVAKETEIFDYMYEFRLLDSSNNAGTKIVTENHVLWNKGMILMDWNRNQMFQPLTTADRCQYHIPTQKYCYPRGKGKMLINYRKFIEHPKADLKYYDFNFYYKKIEHDQRFKDQEFVQFRSYEEMLKDIQKNYMMLV